jgi:hypothetical protein
MIQTDMSPRTRLQVRQNAKAVYRLAVCCGVVGACVLLGGCGSSLRDDHNRARGVVIEAKPGDGNLVASAIWTGETFASENRDSRMASVESDGSSSAE